MAKAQDALQWRVEAKVTPLPDGASGSTSWRAMRPGNRSTGMTLSAVLERPIDRRLDRGITSPRICPAAFTAAPRLPRGQWDLVIELSRQGDRQFRSRNRVVLK